MLRQKSRDSSPQKVREEESSDATTRLDADEPSMTEIMMAASFRATAQVSDQGEATVREGERPDEDSTLLVLRTPPVIDDERAALAGATGDADATAVYDRSADSEVTEVLARSRDSETTEVLARSRDAETTEVLARSRDAETTEVLGRSRDSETTEVLARSRDAEATAFSGQSANGESTLFSDRAQDSGTTLFSIPSVGSAGSEEATQMETRTEIIEEDRNRPLPQASATAGKSSMSRLDSVFKTAAGIAPNAIQQALLNNLAGETLTASSSLLEDQDLEVGVVVKERFVLKEVLGKGGMGTVFKALDLRKVEASDKEAFVALKVLNQDFRNNPISLIALQRETKRAQTLAHPNIITVYDFDRDGAHVFMSMEYMKGRSLSHFIKETVEAGGTPFKQAWPMIEAMGSALEYAHKKDIVHSDFKPGNVFISEKNEVKVLDFGIACAAARPEKETEATIFNPRDDLGAMTPAYASLEQLLNLPPDPRDDIYALACVIYELLCGQHPFGRLSAEKARELKLQPKPLPNLGRRQWKALQRGLAFEQKNRIASAATLLDGLRPRSALFYGFWVAAMLAVTITAGNVYLNLTAKPVEAPKQVIELTAEQKQQIKDLLEIAAIHFEVGYLTAPTGSNALWAYREALKIDPYNEEAIKGIKKVADALEQSAWESFEKGERAESLKKVMEGLEAEPRHEGLSKLKNKLER
jgi:serine/threonine protein kinase